MKLLILPGWQQHSGHWKFCSEALKRNGVNNSVITLPGFGDEPYQKGLDTTADVARWVANYIKRYHKNEDLIILGHSFGGRIAVRLAAEQPDWFKGMILIGSPNIYRPELNVKIKKMLAKIAKPFTSFLPDKARQKLRATDYQVARGTALQTLYKNVINQDQTNELTKINLPVLLLWGELDLQTPLRIAEEMATILPNAKLEVIANAGHDVHLEKYDLLAAKLAAYVKTL